MGTVVSKPKGFHFLERTKKGKKKHVAPQAGVEWRDAREA